MHNEIAFKRLRLAEALDSDNSEVVFHGCRKWRLLNGSPLLAKVIAGVRFVDGVEQTNAA